MPALRLEVGEHGSITYRSQAGRVTASMYYRNRQGQRRRIEATADTKTAAHRAAVEALRKAMASSGGVRWGDVHLDRGLVQICSTVVRIKGAGLVAKAPKTAAGERVLQLPQRLVEVLGERRRGAEDDAPVFPDVGGGYRDRNNVERDYRQVRMGTPFEWVVPHTYRETEKTFLDQGGLSARVWLTSSGMRRSRGPRTSNMGGQVMHSSAASTLEQLAATRCW